MKDEIYFTLFTIFSWNYNNNYEEKYLILAKKEKLHDREYIIIEITSIMLFLVSDYI